MKLKLIFKQMHLILVKMKVSIMLIILLILIESLIQIMIFNTKIKNKMIINNHLKFNFEILLL